MPGSHSFGRASSHGRIVGAPAVSREPRAYPRHRRSISDASGNGVYDSYEALPPDRRAAIAKAVEAERSRIADDRTPAAEPLTELGRDVKNQTDVPTILVDRIVGHVATTKLKDFRGRGNPS